MDSDIANESLKKFKISSIVQKISLRKSYIVLTEIGVGNFGIVFQAIEKQSKKVFAIKCVSLNSKSSVTEIKALKKEIWILNQTNHENCLSMNCLIYDENSFWIVTDYCLGSVRDLMKCSRSGLPIHIVSYVAHFLLQALDYVHSKGWIHRDVKGSNILIDPNGIIKLGDFGSCSVSFQSLSFVGTPYWIAPEVIDSMDEKYYDRKCDIWSFGITCIEMINQVPPNYDKNSVSVLYMISQNDPPVLPIENESSDSTKDEEILLKRFINSTLEKSSNLRPDCNALLQNPFLQKTPERSVILEFLHQCQNFVRKYEEDIEVEDLTENYTCSSLETTPALSKSASCEEKLEIIQIEPNYSHSLPSISASLSEINNGPILAKKGNSVSIDRKIQTIKRKDVLELEMFEAENSSVTRHIDNYKFMRKMCASKIADTMKKHQNIHRAFLKNSFRQLERAFCGLDVESNEGRGMFSKFKNLANSSKYDKKKFDSAILSRDDPKIIELVNNLSSKELELLKTQLNERHQMKLDMRNTLNAYEQQIFDSSHKWKLVELKRKNEMLEIVANANFKKCERSMKKTFEETVKVQDKQFKLLRQMQMGKAANKIEQAKILSKLEDEKNAKLQSLEKQFNKQVSISFQTNVTNVIEENCKKLSELQKQQRNDLEQFEAYQKMQIQNLICFHQNAITSLKSQIPSVAKEVYDIVTKERFILENKKSLTP